MRHLGLRRKAKLSFGSKLQKTVVYLSFLLPSPLQVAINESLQDFVSSDPSRQWYRWHTACDVCGVGIGLWVTIVNSKAYNEPYIHIRAAHGNCAMGKEEEGGLERWYSFFSNVSRQVAAK